MQSLQLQLNGKDCKLIEAQQQIETLSMTVTQQAQEVRQRSKAAFVQRTIRLILPLCAQLSTIHAELNATKMLAKKSTAELRREKIKSDTANSIKVGRPCPIFVPTPFIVSPSPNRYILHRLHFGNVVQGLEKSYDFCRRLSVQWHFR